MNGWGWSRDDAIAILERGFHFKSCCFKLTHGEVIDIVQHYWGYPPPPSISRLGQMPSTSMDVVLMQICILPHPS
jgi:hypothetical protein